MITSRKVSGFFGRIVYTTNCGLNSDRIQKIQFRIEFKITYLRINDKRNLVAKCSEFMTNPEESNTHRSYDEE